MSRLLKQSTARSILIFMSDANDNVTGKAGLTLTITASKNGAGFASISPNVTDLTGGWYTLDLTTAHTDTLGDFGLNVTGSNATPLSTIMQVVADLPGASVSSVSGSVGSVTGNVGGNVVGSVGSVLAAVTIAAASIAAFWDRLTSALTTAGSIGKLLVDNIDAAISSRLASGSYTAPDNTAIAAIQAKTDLLPASPANEATSAAIQAKTDLIPASPADEATSQAIGVIVTAIQAKTDLLPASPASETTVAAVQTAVAAIPTNPLLTNDSRLNTLDALVSTRATPDIKKNTALAGFPFPMYDEDGNPATGLDVTLVRSIDAGAFAPCANDVVEIGSGGYAIDLEDTDLNGKTIIFRASAPDAKTLTWTLVTQE